MTTTPKLTRETREVWPVEFIGDLDGPLGTETVFLVVVGDDTYEFGTFTDAREALAELTAAVRAGRGVFPCSWLVERWHPEPDSPADLVGTCGAPAVVDADGEGWTCGAGHFHRSGIEWYEADEVASYTSRGIPLAANARLMDGSEVW